MSDYTNFEVGEKFPLPIKNQGDGALFQVDANGIMFILQLSRADIIAVEAFRTGKMELALYEENGCLFLLYQIDGIFKDGWGDAPLVLPLLDAKQLPTEKSLKDPTIHLYFVDTRLQILLAQRDVALNDKFHSVIKRHVNAHETAPLTADETIRRIHAIWGARTTAAMRQNAAAVLEIPLNIPKAPPSMKKNLH